MIDVPLLSLDEKEIFILARYYYRNGIYIISNEDYDYISKYLLEYESEFELLYQFYEDDKVPTELLTKYNLEIIDELQSTTSSINNSYNDIRSMRSISTFKEAQELLTKLKGIEVILMPKCDGVSSDIYYRDSKFIKGTSRGRGGNKLDYTRAMNNVLPKKINANEKLFMSAECMCINIDYLSEKYNKTYATSVSASTSALKIEFEKQDYIDNMLVYVFNINHGKTISEGLDYAKSLGFNTVDYLLDTVPEYDVLDWLEAYTHYFYDCGIPIDGMIISVNDKSLLEEMGDNKVYRNGQGAIRLFEFEAMFVEAEVIRLNQYKTKTGFSCVAQIKPIVVAGKKRSEVNVFNPDIAIKAGVRKGNKIKFEIQANGMCNLIYED